MNAILELINAQQLSLCGVTITKRLLGLVFRLGGYSNHADRTYLGHLDQPFAKL